MNSRTARLYADIFTGLVAISIGIALAGLTWRVLGDPGGRVGGALVERAPRQHAIDVDRLIALAPFGASGPITQTSADTSLQLRGILLAQPRSASAALISVGGAAPAPFYVGQQLGGGTIDAIELDRVLMRTGSGVVALAFPDKTGGAPASVPTPATGMTVASPSAPSIVQPRQDFIATIGAVPVSGGYRIGASLPPALRAAGLQPGDVIQRVNGVAVGDAARDATLFANLSAAGSVQLDLIRNGQPISVAVSLR